MSGAVSDFDVVKALIEARNPRLAVGTYEYCEWRTVKGERVRRRFEGVCVGHRDGSLMNGRKTGGNQQRILYRSKRDFVMMLLGCESAAAREFRVARSSPLIKPMAGSMEEMRIQLAARGVDLEKKLRRTHMNAKAIVELADEDWKTQSARKYPNVPAGACNYVPKLFADEAQAKRWIDDDVAEFLRFLKEKSCPDYRIVHDYDEIGLWTPEGDHNIPSRSVWFADVGSADRCSVDFLERSATFWTIVRYSWSEVDYESEMLKRAAGMMPEHVSDDPRW